ncbi:uncharacterized protein LOC132958948, partial [Labrus mixtus]|uniref:uncharacterized protein LOC132958948 n=1 Tax=Labrus mixtus TaxID=508554 RepID=UPI0029C045A7
MINTKYGHLGDFRALVIMQHSLVLFILTYSCGGHSQVIGSSQPIVAIVGDDVILPCQLEPAVDAREITVEWARPDLNPKYVFLWRDGTELQRDKHPMYKGRTSLSEDKLRCGDISLKLTEVKLSDSGAYRCLVLSTKKEYVIKLTAGSVSLPTVSISKASSGVDLQCKSEGWYPEPEVLWLDGEGNLLSAGSTETIRGPNDLYTVSSRVTVERRHNNMFTCRVTQNNINQTREALIHVSDELFMVQSSSIVRITICVIVCFVSIVAVVLVVRKCGQNKKSKKHHEGETDLGKRKMFRHDIEHQLLLEKEGDGDQPMTGNEKMKLLDNIKAKQDEKLEKKERELELVQHVITTLTEQKEDLNILKDKLTSLQQEDMVLIEKKQMKVEDSYRDKTKKKHEKAKEYLEKRKTVHDELLKNTETQLESTDALINRMTERKGKLENDKEQIIKDLKETKRKREELQRKREEVQKQIQRDEIQRREIQREEIQREEIQREEIQRDEIQREEIQREEIQREQIQRDEIQREEIQREEILSYVNTFTRRSNVHLIFSSIVEASFLVREKRDQQPSLTLTPEERKLGHTQQVSRMCHMTFFITFLLLLPQRCKGLLEVIGSPQPILAIVGDDIILPCHLRPAMDVASKTIEWTRPDLKPRFVHVWRSGQELLDAQHPSYEGRTSLFINELKNGNVSLKLSKVRLSDKGKYRCFLPMSDSHSTVELVLGSASSLTVSISKASSGVDLQCKSEGWYPEPEVLWLDGEGNLLSAGSTEIIRGPNDLYTVSSRVTVERRHNNMFTCRVTQNNINQTRETLIHVSDELFMVQSSSIVRITICVIVCFVSIVAVVLVVRKCGQNKKSKKHHEGETDLGERKMFRHDIEHQLLLEKEGDGDQPMTGNEKMELLDNIKAKQDEKLEKKERELELVQQVITTLTEQKKDLKILRTQIISLQQEDMVLIEKNKKMLYDTYAVYGNTKKKLQKTIKDLEKRKTIHDDMLKNTEKQLESTDALINRMTERKGKLENDKEQIIKDLKETERRGSGTDSERRGSERRGSERRGSGTERRDSEKERRDSEKERRDSEK